MQWVAIVLMIIRFIRDLKKSDSKEAFAATASAADIGDGSIIDWIWENREEILEFVLRIIDMFSKQDDQPYFAARPGEAKSVISLTELMEEVTE